MKNIYTLILFCLLSISAIAAPTTFSILPTNVMVEQPRHKSNVYPNPVRTTAEVHFQNPQFELHQLEIYDIIGNRVQIYHNITKNLVEINAAELSSGVYFYFILNKNEKVSTGRIIVRK